MTEDKTMEFAEIVPLFEDHGYEYIQAEAAADVLDGCKESEIRLVCEVIEAIFDAG